MSINSVLRQVPRVFAAVALATGVAGCYGLARVPAGYVSNQRPAQVFVRDADGSVYALTNPTIVQDSLVGNDGEDVLSVNLREVDAMAVRTFSPVRTAGLVASVTAVSGILTFGIIKATSTKDCLRAANRNFQCINGSDGGGGFGCKYDACDADNAYNNYDSR